MPPPDGPHAGHDRHDGEAFCKGHPPSASVRVDMGARKAAGAPSKFVAVLVELVSAARLRATVDQLAAIPTRHTNSTHIGTATTAIRQAFLDAGYTDVANRPWSLGGLSGTNVVCTKPAASGPGDAIVICAHYDSRMQAANDATSPAPGADDNASGVAALLEIARLVADVPLDATITFAAFSGEEQGLLGSKALAQAMHDAGTTIRLVVNLDMVGFPPADGSITVEHDIGNAVAGNDAASLTHAQAMVQAAADHTTLPVKLGPIYASDYMPFEALGDVVIGAYEGEGNPNYHNSSDTAATVDDAYLTQVTRMTLATLLNEALAAVDEASSPVDLYIRDNPTDQGDTPSAVPHWVSPDIWVRNADIEDGDDPEQGHQPPINGVPNYMYVRVHNRGTVAVAGAASLEAFRCNPGTGMVWPDHFQSLGTLTITDPIPAGGSARVGPFVWTPQIVDHECLLAVVTHPEDHAVPDVVDASLPHGTLVRFDNNVGQRNVAPQMATPGGKVRFHLTLRGGSDKTTNSWSLDAGSFPDDTGVTVRVPRRIVDRATTSTFTSDGGSPLKAALTMVGGTTAELTDFGLDAGDRVAMEVTIDFSHEAEHLARYPLVATQHQDGAIAGRLTMEVTAVKDLDEFFFGNPRSHEAHISTCPFWDQLGPGNRVPYATLGELKARGYDGCAFCLPDADTG